MKSEIEEIKKDLKKSDIALKSANKEIKDVSHRFEKKMEALKNENRELLEYKMIKISEAKNLKTKMKKAAKKQKILEEKEAKIEIEKLRQERVKHFKFKSEDILNVEENNNPEKAEDQTKESTPHTISTSYYNADISTYPSMVSHWRPPNPDTPTFTEYHRRVLKSSGNKLSILDGLLMK